MQVVGQRNQQSRSRQGGGQDVSNLPRAQKHDLPHFDNINSVITSHGSRLTLGRLYQNLWFLETIGDYDCRLRDAAAIHEYEFGQDEYKLHGVRITSAPGAHRFSDVKNDPANPNIPGDFILGHFKPKAKDTSIPREKVQPIIHIPSGFESVMNSYEEVASVFNRPLMSTKGYGIGFVPLIAPALKLGIFGHDHTADYSYDQFAEALLTKWGAFWEENPELNLVSRQSLMKGTAYGMQTPVEIPEYNISMPLGCSPEEAKRYNEGREPGEMIEVLPFRSQYAEQLTAREKDYAASRRGRTNPDSGEGLARIVILGEPPGQFGNPGSGLTMPEQRLRVMQIIRNWCEEFCIEYPKDPEDPEKDGKVTPAIREKYKDHPKPARVPKTFSIIEQRGVKNHSGLDIATTPELPVWVVQIPYEELSLLERQKVYPDNDGTTPAMEDGKYKMPRTSWAWGNLRQDRNEGANAGTSGSCGRGGKEMEIDLPYEMEVSLPEFEDAVCKNYANCMDGDFVPEGYCYDSFMGPVQNARPKNPANNRMKILWFGKFISVKEDSQKAHDRKVGLQQTNQIISEERIQQWEEESAKAAYQKAIDNKQSDAQAKEQAEIARKMVRYTLADFDPINGERHIASTDYTGKLAFELTRNAEGKFDEIFKSSGWIQVVELVYQDTKRAREVSWANRDKTAGYLVLDLMSGEDVELPAVLYNIYVTTTIANLMDELTEKHCKAGEEIKVSGASDLLREWPDAYQTLRNPQILRDMGYDLDKIDIDSLKETPEGREALQKAIIRTKEPAVTFRWRFMLRVAITKDSKLFLDDDKPVALKSKPPREEPSTPPIDIEQVVDLEPVFQALLEQNSVEIRKNMIAMLFRQVYDEHGEEMALKLQLQWNDEVYKNTSIPMQDRYIYISAASKFFRTLGHVNPGQAIPQGKVVDTNGSVAAPSTPSVSKDEIADRYGKIISRVVESEGAVKVQELLAQPQNADLHAMIDQRDPVMLSGMAAALERFIQTEQISSQKIFRALETIAAPLDNFHTFTLHPEFHQVRILAAKKLYDLVELLKEQHKFPIERLYRDKAGFFIYSAMYLIGQNNFGSAIVPKQDKLEISPIEVHELFKQVISDS